MDFVHDQLYDRTRIRALTIIDTFTRYVPAIDVRRSCTGADVVETLERVLAIRSPFGSALTLGGDGHRGQVNTSKIRR